MSSEFDEQLIGQLVLESSSLDQTIGAVFKTIFASSRQQEFIKSLQSYSIKKEHEIEKLCHQNSLNFVKSVDELLGLREESSKLKRDIGIVQDELSSCGQLLLDTKVEMHETRKMFYTTKKQVETLSQCLQALNIAQAATLEIMDQNFGQALRLIEQLRTDHLPKIEQFSFSIKLQKWIPEQLQNIRNFALEELKIWLSRVREQTLLVGEVAFSRAQKRIEKWRNLYEGVSTPAAINLSISNTEDFSSATAYLELVEMEREDAASIINNDRIQIDFAPVLKAFHLFNLMHCKLEFQSLFAENRRAQAKVIFDFNINQKDEANSFASWLHQICGFFVIEYFILRKPQGFYSFTNVESLWERALTRVNEIVIQSLSSAATSDQGVLIKIKWLLVFFSHSIEIYDIYSVNSIMDTILSLFYRFVDLSRNECSKRLITSANECSLQPLSVTNSSMLGRLRKQLSFLNELDGDTDQAQINLPFSNFPLDVFNLLSDFINNFYVFLEGVPQHSSEHDELVKKKCDSILDDSCKALLERLAGSNFDESIQILRDFDCLIKICPDIEKLLSSKRNRAGSTQVTIMGAAHVLTKAKHDTETHIFRLINVALDRIFKDFPYEYLPSESLNHPSALITEFGKFYSRTLVKLERILPYNSMKQLIFNMFGHLSTRMSEILYDKSVTSFNMNFIEDLDTDLSFLQHLAVDEVKDVMVMETFSDLRQLVSLIKSNDVHEFLDPMVRNRKYPNLRSNDIIPVLQKLTEPVEKKRKIEDLVVLIH